MQASKSSKKQRVADGSSASKRLTNSSLVKRARAGDEARYAAWACHLLERLFGEERRRTKVIPHAFGERAVLKLMYAALMRAGQTWQRVAINEFELRQIDDLRNELDEDFKQRTVSTVTNASRRRFSSNPET